MDRKQYYYISCMKGTKGTSKLSGSKKKECPCPKLKCPNKGKCGACFSKHKSSGTMSYCFSLANDGDKSLQNFHHNLLGN